MTPNPEIAKLFTETFDGYLAELETTPDVTGRPSKAFPDGEDYGWWSINGPRMIEFWQEWRRMKPWSSWTIWEVPGGVPAIELAIQPVIADLPISMIIDRVFDAGGRLIVVDLKTGSRKPDSLLQLGLYKVGLELVFPGVKIAGGAHWMGRAGELSGIVTLDQYTPQLFERYFRRYRAALAAEFFVPQESALCKTCSVREYCAVKCGPKAHLDPDYPLIDPRGGNLIG